MRTESLQPNHNILFPWLPLTLSPPSERHRMQTKCLHVVGLRDARSIAGNFAPRPYRDLAPDQAQALLDNPVIREVTAA